MKIFMRKNIVRLQKSFNIDKKRKSTYDTPL